MRAGPAKPEHAIVDLTKPIPPEKFYRQTLPPPAPSSQAMPPPPPPPARAEATPGAATPVATKPTLKPNQQVDVDSQHASIARVLNLALTPPSSKMGSGDFATTRKIMNVTKRCARCAF